MITYHIMFMNYIYNFTMSLANEADSVGRFRAFKQHRWKKLCKSRHYMLGTVFYCVSNICIALWPRLVLNSKLWLYDSLHILLTKTHKLLKQLNGHMHVIKTRFEQIWENHAHYNRQRYLYRHFPHLHQIVSLMNNCSERHNPQLPTL